MKPVAPSQWTSADHFLVRVGSWFDGTTLHSEPALIEIKAGRIVAVRAGLETDLATAATGDLPVLDAAWFSAAPALVDAHVHCYLSAWPIDPKQRKSPGEKAFEVEVAEGLNRVAEMQGCGIGAARDMGDPKLYNNAIRARLAAAGSPFTLQSGGQGLFMPGRYGRFLGIAAEPADLVKEVDRLAAVEKVDFIKLIPTGIINFNKGTVSAPPSYAVEQIAAVVGRAHELGLKVAAHCSGAAGLDRCIAGRVDFIEHAYFGTRTHLEKMRDAGLHWTPTFIPVHVQWKHATVCGWDEKTQANLLRILDEHYERLRVAREIGLSVLTGSDAGGGGVGHGGGLIEEVERLATVYSAAEAHSIATQRTHTAIGITDEGRIEPGAKAKLVLYARPPATEILQLREPRWLVQAARVTAAHSPRTSDLPNALQFGVDPTAAAAVASGSVPAATAAAAPAAH